MEITDEERKKAKKILGGLTWIGDEEDHIRGIVKNQIRRKEGYYKIADIIKLSKSILPTFQVESRFNIYSKTSSKFPRSFAGKEQLI